MNTAQAVILANVFSENAFGLTAWNFLTSDESAGFTSNSSAARITLRELIRRGTQVHYGTDQTELQLIGKNIRDNSTALIMGLVGIPIAFMVAKKVLRKPLLLPANRMLKMAGLNQVKLG